MGRDGEFFMFIEFKNTSYVYFPKTPFEYKALDKVSLKLKEGNMTAIIGHTGSGKSTLAQHINGLLVPSYGEVCIKDYVITNKAKLKGIKQLRKYAGMVFQFPEYQLFEETVYKDIAFGPKNFGIQGEELDALVKKSLHLVGLDESYLERSPFELSGGQKRRIAIAGILALDPEVLILDEPTAGLDPQGAIEMMELFKLLNNLGKTIIMITHEMDFVLKYCDEVVVMKKANVVAKTTPVEFFYNEDLLKEVTIEEPLVVSFTKELINKGLKLDIQNIKDVESLAVEIASIKQKGGVDNE